jgi:hypothetical protein
MNNIILEFNEKNLFYINMILDLNVKNINDLY